MPYSPNFRQGSFSEAHIHTPAYLYGSGAYESELCSASFRVDSFSETGLPINDVLGNSEGKKGAGAPLPRFLVSPLRLNT
jgi:hypothetical protein